MKRGREIHTHTLSLSPFVVLFFFSFFFLKTMIPWRLLVFFPCQCQSNSKVVDIFLLPWPSLAVSMLFSNREWHINDSLYRVWCATLRGPQPPYGQHPLPIPSHQPLLHRHRQAPSRQTPPPHPTHTHTTHRLSAHGAGSTVCVTRMTKASAYVGANSNGRHWPLK